MNTHKEKNGAKPPTILQATTLMTEAERSQAQVREETATPDPTKEKAEAALKKHGKLSKDSFAVEGAWFSGSGCW